MKLRFLIPLLFSLLAPLQLWGQAWSPFIDPSRATTWQGTAGFTIPNYTVACPTTVSLASGSGNATANATSIMAALASCDSSHNVVNIPAGTWYVAGFHYGSQGFQVLLGAGANSTHIISTSEDPCSGQDHGVCMLAGDWTYSGDPSVLPVSSGGTGTRQCSWAGAGGTDGTYTQGATSIHLTGCGTSITTALIGKILVLDQANDVSDTSGVYICNSATTNCTYDPSSNANGRILTDTAHQYSSQQIVKITGMTSLGGGGYTVTISPGVYSTNIRSSQNPGAWYGGFVQNLGLENLSVDGTLDSAHGTMSIYSCYQCWVKGVTFLNSSRNAVSIVLSSHDVIRDSYFFGAQSSHTQSYNIEGDSSSDLLVENNIMQQVTTPLNWNGGIMGSVVAYNYAIKMIYTDGTWAWPIFSSHGPGSNFNLFEGNVNNGINADNSSGPSDQDTAFRNMFIGWQPGTTNATIPFIDSAHTRNWNLVGNVLGQPGYHTSYQIIATSTSTFSGGPEDASIYAFGLAGLDTCSIGTAICDPIAPATAMRWGNYDTVNAAVRWNSTEAAPGAVTYVAANFSTGYFNTLSHTLPASLYYGSTPSWWPGGKAWPPIGPDVSTGNVGICTGTYAGAQATTTGQCGAALITAWASHVTSIPAQDCFLSLGGPPDGSGSVLAFDATTCYSAVPTVATPTFSPAAGTFTTPQTVALSVATGGASIVYTTDGSTPTVTALTCTITHGLSYGIPIFVSASETVKAIGCLSGDNASSVASAAYVIPTPTIALARTEGSNSNSPTRDAYTNCATSCVSGVWQPINSGSVSNGQLACTAAAQSSGVTNGCSARSVVGGTITGATLSNGLGAGGSDSLASLSISWGNALAGDCGTVPTTSALIPTLSLLGAVPSARSLFSAGTQGSFPNTSFLAPAKWPIPGGDAYNYYDVQMCETVPTTTGTGFHLELDLNHTLSNDDYIGPGSHYDFSTSKWSYDPQGFSPWRAMNLVEFDGTVHTTMPFPAGHSLYMEWIYHRTPTCSSSSGSNCYFWDYACITDVTAATPAVCGAWQDASSGLTPGGIPVHKAGFRTNEINVQTQGDLNQVSITRTINSDFRTVTAFNFSGSGPSGPPPPTGVIVLQ